MKVNKQIIKRVEEEADYMIETKETIRKVASKFRVSKSTVHKDVSERLPKIQPQLYPLVKEILELNKQERHIRGGLATKEKYAKLEQQKHKY